MKLSKCFYVAAVVVVGGALNSAANAAVFVGTGSSGGVPVSSSATFTATAGKLTIVLTNSTVHTADAAQLLTGLQFKAATGGTAITTATFSATGKERTIAADGTFTDSGVKALTWELKSGTTLEADFNPDATDGIIGPADASGLYSANGSINSNPGHNPYADQSITLVLSNAAITSTTTVSNVTFLYNTGLSQAVSGSGTTPTPEPASLGALGLGAVALLTRRKRL